jgi:hypothetical protein
LRWLERGLAAVVRLLLPLALPRVLVLRARALVFLRPEAERPEVEAVAVARRERARAVDDLPVRERRPADFDLVPDVLDRLTGTIVSPLHFQTRAPSHRVAPNPASELRSADRLLPAGRS